MSWLKDRVLNEPPHSPPYVIENMDKARPHGLATVFDIDLMATSTAVVAPVWIAALGVVVSFVAAVGSGAGERLLIGLAYGLLMGAKARRKVQRTGWVNVRLIQADARTLSEDLLKDHAGIKAITSVLLATSWISTGWGTSTLR